LAQEEIAGVRAIHLVQIDTHALKGELTKGLKNVDSFFFMISVSHNQALKRLPRILTTFNTDLSIQTKYAYRFLSAIVHCNIPARRRGQRHVIVWRVITRVDQQSSAKPI